ncbi:MAG TPA: septal ring lytic transglycosylase RlpA family protein [Stellaceae bacterium]|nr:septal ring lytic transglycosylase RlpA family protein [Stellaceae bacterium]
MRLSRPADRRHRAARGVSLAVVMMCALAACAAPPRPVALTPSGPSPPASSFTQVGLASWYGNAHAGRRTASGEPFDPGALTAAHRTLPLGAVVRVTSLVNRRSVEVRINDRGPADLSRIIDLSKRAAAELDFTTDGTARVRIELLRSSP